MARGTWLTAIAASATIGAAAPAPLANYSVDVATTSGFGAGMAAGQRPGLGQMMSMMRGGGGSVAHTLELRLTARNGTAGTASHIPPPALGLGPQLPLLTPEPVTRSERSPGEMPTAAERPRGRILIYWGCGEHVGPGQPLVIDLAKIVPGQIPPAMMEMMMARRGNRAAAQAAPTDTAARWPNREDSRAVPASGSLVGAHRVQASYAPPIAFSLAANQDFMPALGLREGGSLPSGASRLNWTLAPQATGYALGLFGAGEGAAGAGGSGSGSSGNGGVSGGGGADIVMWSSAGLANHFPAMDYLAPAEVRRQIAANTVLAPTVGECVLPAEVARAAPAGIVTMIGYGPEVSFAEAPTAPKWTAKLRFKSSASLIRGLGAQGDAARQGEPPRPKRRFGIGDLLRGAVPHP